jgi:hypothetical protein
VNATHAIPLNPRRDINPLNPPLFGVYPPHLPPPGTINPYKTPHSLGNGTTPLSPLPGARSGLRPSSRLRQPSMLLYLPSQGKIALPPPAPVSAISLSAVCYVLTSLPMLAIQALRPKLIVNVQSETTSSYNYLIRNSTRFWGKIPFFWPFLAFFGSFLVDDEYYLSFSRK